jgi:ubiquinone/menaquinone biosynthesis C-methylase UbiE
VWPSLERTARFVRAAYVDARLLLTGKSERGIPPLRLRFVGSGDFRAVGEHLLWLAETRGHLKPDSRILDIGCGSGRFALPLTKLLAGGEYEGFDVVAAATRWCTRNITRQHPNFHFTHVSLRNSDYSVRGGAASRFVFPNRDSYFDCVVAFSVFTHLQFAEMCNYLQESHRVLVPGGRLVATFFLLNAQSRTAQRTVPGVQQFPHADGPVHFARQSNPSHAVAVEENVLRDVLSKVGFREVAIESGSWFGMQTTAEFQDLVVCVK